ncbi:hypothetical protein HGRIS_011121 [Hohenbuehelia grisea]|uniref:AB hydrolase-1 domain-containing protein n=1 Tax=Hohenbuehelia grisea TaxID=104357 RepID=A0ABR3IZ08_9AGAR
MTSTATIELFDHIKTLYPKSLPKDSSLDDDLTSFFENPWYMVAEVTFSSSNLPDAVPLVFEHAYEDLKAIKGAHNTVSTLAQLCFQSRLHISPRTCHGPTSCCRRSLHCLPILCRGTTVHPHDSHDNGLTFLLLHAMTLHTETFQPMVTSLLQEKNTVPGLRIKDVWCIDNPNHGQSAVLNAELLNSPEYREHWNAREYAKGLYSLLSTTSHGVNFRRRKLVGMGHSAGGVALMSLLEMQPKIRFEAILLLDAGIVPPIESSEALLAFFGKVAASKKHTWDSRDDAFETLGSKSVFKVWHPDAFKSFIANGLKPVESSKVVTLSLSPKQEAAYYASKDIIAPAVQTFINLTREDSIPVHVIAASPDEYRGKMDDMKNFQIEHVSKMSRGGVHYVEKGGHLYPQSEPVLAAQAIRKALEFVNVHKAVVRPHDRSRRCSWLGRLIWSGHDAIVVIHHKIGLAPLRHRPRTKEPNLH